MSAARKKNTKPKQAASRSKQPAPKPHHPVARVVGGLVCLFLALCVVVTYFGVEATLLTLLAQLVKGLVGYGYWVTGLLLIIAGVNLIGHKDRPVIWRTVCTLLLPVLVGSLLHLLLCGREYEVGSAMVSALWTDGKLLACGGVLSGGLAELGTVALSGVVTAILLLILLLAGIFVMARTTPQRVVEKVRESRACDPYAEEEEELPPADKPLTIQVEPKRRRNAIDIPLDAEPAAAPMDAKEEMPSEEAAALQPERKGFFARRSADIKTPAEVVASSAAEDAAPPRSKSMELTQEEVQSAA